MDNQESLKQNFELPAPAVDASHAETGAELGQSHESQTTPSSTQQPTDLSTQASGSVTAGTHAGGTATPAISSTVLPTHAEDADLIEKEWVEKAKQIVSQTIGDPYSQNKEINKIKADYIKKRYNKDIKLTTD